MEKGNLRDFSVSIPVDSFILREPTCWRNRDGQTFLSHEAVCILTSAIHSESGKSSSFLFFDKDGLTRRFLYVGDYMEVEYLTESVSRKKKYICFIPACEEVDSISLCDPEYRVSVRFHQGRGKFLCLV